MGIDFSRIADRYDETRGGAERGARFAGELAPLLPPGRLLELGVGTGVVAVALGRPVVGVDIAGGMLRGARERLGPRVVRYDGRRLPFRDLSFDGAYAVWVMHLVDDQAGLFAEVRRVLKPGGRLVVAGVNQPPRDDVDRILGPMFEALQGDRIGRDRPDRLAPLARSAGLEVVTVVPGAPFRDRMTGPAEAAKIERRDAAAFWDLDDARWREIVEPALAALRALGDAEIEREYQHDVILLERKAG